MNSYHSNSCERPLANAYVKNSQGVKIIIIFIRIFFNSFNFSCYLLHLKSLFLGKCGTSDIRNKKDTHPLLPHGNLDYLYQLFVYYYYYYYK